MMTTKKTPLQSVKQVSGEVSRTTPLFSVDNPALMGDLLTRVASELKKLGFKISGNRKDTKGLFAFEMQSPTGFPFMLVCKGSDIYRNLFSCQLDLVQSWKAPLIIGWLPQDAERPLFYVFDPALILSEKKFLNTRFDETMVNFSVNLGRLWYPEDESIESVWAKARSKQQILVM